MAERKLKCAHCGKWFKAADYKHTLCPNCERLERAKRAAPAPAAARPGLGNGRSAVATVAPAIVPARPAPVETAPIRPEASVPTPASVTDSVAEHKAVAPRPPATLTEAQLQAVERRYLELAAPEEFDGVRGQIAAELKLPKTLVKRAVNALRRRLGRLSWWELQQQSVTAEVYAAVKSRYAPLLADGGLPPVGVHRQIAEEANLSTLQVYRAIGRIRTDMGLPRFNEREPEASEAEAAPAPEQEAPVNGV